MCACVRASSGVKIPTHALNTQSQSSKEANTAKLFHRQVTLTYRLLTQASKEVYITYPALYHNTNPTRKVAGSLHAELAQ